MLEKKPRPRIKPNRASEPFFAAAREGRLRLPYCAGCGQLVHPGLQHCQGCLGEAFDWREASGRGTVHSYVVMNRALHSQFPGGYHVCVVELDEGLRFVAEVTTDRPSVGLAVRAEINGNDAERAPLRFVPA
jgi:uncharacterized OB-fold protein